MQRGVRASNLCGAGMTTLPWCTTRLTGEGVDGDMQFAPVPVLGRFSERAHRDREARAVDHNVDWLVACGRFSSSSEIQTVRLPRCTRTAEQGEHG